VRRHVGQIVQLLVEHLGNHADLFVAELGKQRRRLVICNVGRAALIGVDEQAQRNVEANAVVLLEYLPLSVANDVENGVKRPAIDIIFP
jgi:hypothetical protein